MTVAYSADDQARVKCQSVFAWVAILCHDETVAGVRGKECILKNMHVVMVLLAMSIMCVVSSDGWARGNKNNGASKMKAAHAAAQKRKQEKHEAYLEKKSAEGEKDWTLTGTFRGTATTLQFIPDKAGDGEKQIASLSLYGEHKESVLSKLGAAGGDHKAYIGKRATISFHGKPERHGSGLRFNLMKGGVMEWQDVRLLD